VVPLEKKPPVSIVRKVDDETRRHLSDGGCVILFPQAQDEFLTRNKLELNSSILGGHSNVFYARKGLGIFDRIPYENPYIWQFRRIWPDQALFGINPEDRTDILAGAYKNYLHKHCATMAQFRCGGGRLILCTFDLLRVEEGEPAAVIIFNVLLKYAAGDFHPRANLIV
jgi:hypothetical protein